MITKIFLVLFAICSLLSVICTAQIQFQRRIGGTGPDIANCIIRTTDGGYAAAGTATTLDDMYIVKLDSSAWLQWSRTVGGTSLDNAYSIIQTTDGGYAVAGVTNSFGPPGYDYMYIVKLDTAGTLQWSRTVGKAGSDYAYSIAQTTDGGYAVAGCTYTLGAGNADMYIVKLDTGGTLQWSRTVGGTNFDYAYSIILTTDGGYAVAGYTNSFEAGNRDMYIVKLNSNGTLQWSRTVGGTYFDEAYSIIQTTDGGYAVTGRTTSFGAGYYDMYIVKLNVSGSLQWSKAVGGSGDDRANSIIQTTDGGYAVVGRTPSFGVAYYDMYIVKLNVSGLIQWSKTVGGSGSDYANSIIQTTDGGYVVAGGTTSFGAGYYDMYIVKLDSGGNTCGNFTTPASQSGTGGITTSQTPTVTTPISTVTSPTSTTGTRGTVTTICVVGIQEIGNLVPVTMSLSQNYPNPFNPTTKIKFNLPKSNLTQSGAKGLSVKLIIYDILGREIATLVNQQLKPGTYEVEWDGSNYPSGVYFYRLTCNEFVETKKMILIK